MGEGIRVYFCEHGPEDSEVGSWTTTVIPRIGELVSVDDGSGAVDGYVERVEHHFRQRHDVSVYVRVFVADEEQDDG